MLTPLMHPPIHPLTRRARPLPSLRGAEAGATPPRCPQVPFREARCVARRPRPPPRALCLALAARLADLLPGPCLAGGAVL